MNQELEYQIYKRYEIVQRLGSGTYGVVYKVIDKRSGAVCAIKKICDAFQNRTDSQRTYREILYLSEIAHSRIVQLFDVIEAKNGRDVYLVFQYVEFDVAGILKTCPLEPIQRKHIAYQLLVAVEYLHSAGILHRDIKPSNILIDRQCSVKLCDFGLSRSLNSMREPSNQTIMTQYVAARWYRPPEVILSTEKYDYAVDIWAVGCVMAELVLKRPLFAGESTLDQLEKILSVVGMPKKQEVDQLESHEAHQLLSNFYNLKKMPLADILFDAGDEELDLLMGLLQFSPGKRLPARQALKHPYFDQILEMENQNNNSLSYKKTKSIREQVGSQHDYKQLVHGLAISYREFDKTSNFTSTYDQLAKRKSDTLGEVGCSSKQTNNSFVRSTNSLHPTYKKSVKSKSGLSCKGKSTSKGKPDIRRPSKTKYQDNRKQKNVSIIKPSSKTTTIHTSSMKQPLKMRKVGGKKTTTTVSQKLFKTGSATSCFNSLLSR